MDARMQKHRAIRWLWRFVAALLLVLFATANPAQAAVESVAPVADGGIWLFWDPNNWSPPTSSPDVACNSGYNAQWMPGNGFTYVGSVPNQYGYANLGWRDCIFTDRTGQIRGGGSIKRDPFPPTCPIPTVNPTVPYSYNVTNGMCEREQPCPVDPLPELPKGDLCAQSLEEGAGEDVNKACPSLTPEMEKQAQCVYDKIRKLSPPISYPKPSATIRNTAYQNHLVEVWNKSKEIKKKRLSEAEKLACAAVIAHVARHGIDSPPSQSGNDAPHVQGRAIDIPKDTAKALMRQTATIITMPKPPGCLPCIDNVTIISDVQDYVNSATENPPACNLRWGGRFTPVDKVHFQLP